MDFRIAIELDIPPDAPVDKTVFPRLAEAFAALVNAAHEKWVEYAHGKPLPSGLVIHPRSGSYARSIAVNRLGDFGAEVYSAIPYASAIEAGSPARDLHDLLQTSRKTRLTKDGKRYLIIPFRWGTPGTASNPRVGFGDNVMPAEVHKGWLSGSYGESSRIIGHGWRISGSGHRVRQRSYSWGGRVAQSDLDALGIGTDFKGKSYKTHPMAGMVQMRRGGTGAKHTQYLTFRTMTEGSPGWLVPAIEGRWPARTVAEQIKPIAERVLKEAVAADLRRWAGAG